MMKSELIKVITIKRKTCGLKHTNYVIMCGVIAYSMAGYFAKKYCSVSLHSGSLWGSFFVENQGAV